ncbi:hypothetical protein LOD99_6124 [Oopsacas minuta]|uniref:Uncharacterized protein n=1 Tax=Oopsacas minuta TaxID=111878 RepID=A0AAV7JML1_9METZ|nr:hypothetical protein LOD99_6124 [Oopsacas minuta]
MRKEKSEIIRDVKWYLSKNFFRLPSFYRVLFNCFPFKPYLPYIVRNVLTNPDYVMEHVPDNLKIYARLTLMEIDSLQKPRISELHRQAKESTLAEKCSARQLNVYKTILQNPTRKLSKSEAKTLGEKIVHSIQQSRNPGQLIASYIEKITFDFQHLGSNRDGNCKLHALSMKLTDLFAAEFINTHSDKRIIFHFDAGRLTFYTILNSHQYPLLKFTKKIGNLYEEKLFLNYFNQVKYRYTRIEDRIKSLAEILQNLQNKFSLNTQQYFTNNISKIHSLLS